MRKAVNIWMPIVLLSVILGVIYFRQWFVTARTIRGIHELQRADIAMLTRARTALSDISNLSILLRLKLFGPGAAEEAVLASVPSDRPAPLPPAVLSALKRHAVRLVYYRRDPSSIRMQFEGDYDGLVRFLSVARADLPRIDGFSMERAGATAVRLTLSFGAA